MPPWGRPGGNSDDRPLAVPGRDGPDGAPYGMDWGGCRPYGDILWTGNFWQYPNTTYDCFPPYPPVNVRFGPNTEISGRSGVPRSVLANAGIRPGQRPGPP